MTLYDRIKMLAEERGMSIRKAEQEIGIPNGIVGSWRKSNPMQSSLQKVADYFNVSIDYLTGKSEVRNKEKSTLIPVYASIPAGIPLEAISDVVDYEDISEDLALRGEYFGIKVKGDSMEPELRTGDVLIVRCQPEAETGDIVVAGVGSDEATVKKLIMDGLPILQPLNPAYPPIVGKPVKIYGKVGEVRRRFK